MANFDFLLGNRSQGPLVETPEWMENVPAPGVLPVRQKPARTQPSTMEILQAALGRNQTPDFRGMTPEQIQGLQANQRAQQAQRLGIANAIIGQQAARRKAQQARDIAALERIREDQAAIQKQQYEMDKVRLKNRLDKQITPLERRKTEADIGALNALTKQREAIAAGNGLNPYQNIRVAQINTQIEQAKKRLDFAKTKAEQDTAVFEIKKLNSELIFQQQGADAETEIMKAIDEGNPESIRPTARYINNTYDYAHYWYTPEKIVIPGLGNDIGPEDSQALQLPIAPSGRPITMAQVRAYAEKPEYATVEDVLVALGVLEKLDSGAYIPARKEK